jgi:hypothetical protein
MRRLRISTMPCDFLRKPLGGFKIKLERLDHAPLPSTDLISFTRVFGAGTKGHFASSAAVTQAGDAMKCPLFPGNSVFTSKPGQAGRQLTPFHFSQDKNAMNLRPHFMPNTVTVLAASLALFASLTTAQTPPQNSNFTARSAAQSPKFGTVAIAVPDVTFDVGASRMLSVQAPFNVALKNSGASASAPFEVQCDFKEMRLPPAGTPVTRATTQKFNVPSMAIGASYTTQNAGPPNDGSTFLSRSEIKCVADTAATSGEINKTNNTFEFSPPNSGASTPMPDIAFDVAAMTGDAKNNRLRTTVKNIGNFVNRPFKVTCETVIDTLMSDGRKERKTTTDTIDVLTLYPGGAHATQSLSGAWLVERLSCTADSGNTSGESNKTNNTFSYQRAPELARIDIEPARNLGGTGAAAHLTKPDLAFDVPTMTADADRRSPNSTIRTSVGYRIAVKNIGNRASSPTEVICTDVTDFLDAAPGPNQGKPLPRRTWSWTRPVPAVAPGATYRDSLEVLGADDLIRRTCVIDGQSVSGDTNKSNNAFEFQKNRSFAATVGQRVGTDLDVTVRLTAPDLAFDVSAMNSRVRFRPILIKNVGNRASTTAKVSCSGMTQSLTDAMEKAGAGSGEALSVWEIPAIAPGQSHVFLEQPETRDLTAWGCNLIDVAGETNSANNQYRWNKPRFAVARSATTPLRAIAPATP